MVPCCGTPILPYLFLGDESDASDPDKLKSLNIYYVLNVTADLPGDGENGFIRYKRIPARDSFDQNLVQYFEESFQFIEEARKAGRAVLIHCHAGISRSPTIVVAYLMYSQKMTFNSAYKFVESKRPIISPNFSFVGQLYEYGKTQLKACLSTCLPLQALSVSSPTSPIGTNTISISKSISALTGSTPTLTIASKSTSNTTTTSTFTTNTTTISSTTSTSTLSLLTSSTPSNLSKTNTITTITTSISAPTTPTSPMPLPPLMPTTPIVTTLPTPTTPTNRSYLKISDTLNKPFFLLPPPLPSSFKEGLTKPDFPSSCEALSDIPYNSLGPVRGCRSRKSCNNDFILLRPIKMTKNARVK